ncbi:MAG: ABC transporter permease [Candidatus Accumulibacter sp.]|jgi:putative ABC transport system permease protein|nr:ABC transporter permease [Accumulibacter sp.]
MRPLFFLALQSAWNRRLTLGLVAFSLLASSALLLSLERVRHAARMSFTTSVAGVDLIVGARSSPLQLTLYAVFHLGDASQNMDWKSYQTLAAHPAVAWSVPLSLGDSHRGFPVLGTTPDYFRHYRYGEKMPLRFAAGQPFRDGLFDAVIGAEAAQTLGYRLGGSLTLSHGAGKLPGLEHADKPFSVVGILAPTGTPADRTIHVSLAAIEAIHLDWQGGMPIPGFSIPAEAARKFDLTPKTITAFLVGLKQRAAVFKTQREIAAFADEPLMAVLPGVALDELWQTVGVIEKILRAVSWLALSVSLAGLAAVMLAGLNERRREIAILRAVGAGPRHIAFLLLLESFFVSLLGIGGAVLLVRIATPLAGHGMAAWGLSVWPDAVSAEEGVLMAEMFAAALLVSLWPLLRAYRQSLADGLIPRI